MPGPVFEYVQCVNDTAKSSLRVVHVEGLPTKHGDRKSDRGRLHGRLLRSGLVHTLTFFSTFARAVGDAVLSGTTSEIGAYFDLAEVNASGMSGRAYIESYSSDSDSILILPTFAVDHDVLVDAGRCASMPGYDPKYGLGAFHAQAVRQILAADLPRAVPHLFGGAGLAAMVPTAYSAVALPDLSTIANPDQIRVAQASLVKALSAEQAEHLQEFADIAKLARERYAKAMQDIAEANVLDEQEASEFEADRQISVSTFSRI